MKTRKFGGTELTVSDLGFGCARIGGIFQREGDSFERLLRTARDLGINFFDTADMYSQGESETLVGRAFRGRRDSVVIASKAGYCLPARRKFIARLKPLIRPVIQKLGIKRERLPGAVKGTITQDFSPTYLRQAIEGTLKRLRTDYLDLYQLHSPPAEIVERGEWVDALERIKESGKIRYYGVACDTQEAALASLRFPGVSSLQLRLNLLEPERAEGVLPALRSGSVAVIARECLANGLLVKPAHEIDLAKYASSPEERAQRESRLAELRGKAQNGSLARLALDYVRGLDGVSVSLVGARTSEQLTSLLREIEAR